MTTEIDDQFKMDDMPPLDMEEQPQDAPEPGDPKPEEGEDKEPPPTSFTDAFEKAMQDGEVTPEADGEPDKEPDAAEEEKEPAPEPESRSAKDFRKIKEDRDSARRELEELKAKLGKLENQDVDNVMAELQKERDSLSEQLKLAAIERHPKFQKQYEDKVTTLSEQAKRIVGDDHGERVAELLKMKDGDYRASAIEEIMIDLSTTKQAQLGALLTRMDEVRGERETALANASETYKTLMADQEAQRTAQLEQTHKVFDTVSREAGNLEIYQTREGDEDWNREVQSRLDTARSIYSGENDPAELARASLWASAGPKYRELLVAQVELNRRLRKQLEEQSGANPGVSTSAEGGRTEPRDFTEHFMEVLNS